MSDMTTHQHSKERRSGTNEPRIDAALSQLPGKTRYITRGQTNAQRRGWQNAAAAVLLIALIAGGALLIRHLQASMKMEACVESGRRDCAIIETPR
jgi:ferric-dicitrate binding protein FerR (iron transport regulator)